IRRFVDADAEFLYVPSEEVATIAEREGAVPYDVKDVELGHVDGRCSFESIMIKYALTDPALEHLARIVHGADVAADIDIVPEARGLYAIAHGFALVHGDDDHAKIRLETPMYDALYAWCQKQVAKGRGLHGEHGGAGGAAWRGGPGARSRVRLRGCRFAHYVQRCALSLEA